MRFTWLFIIAELLFLDVHAQKIVPGEWEAQESIWVPFLSQSVRSSEDSITVQLIKKLSEHMNTVIVVEDDSVINRGKSLFARFNVDTSKIRLVKISPINMWLRDIGPVFYYSGENADMLSICNFKFTSYRNIPYEEVTDHTQLLDASGRKIGDLEGIQVHESELVLEGGAFEVNGKGCIILVDSLVLKRNQSFSKEQIENELAVKLGIKSFIWLRQGLAQDPYGSRYFGNGVFASGTGGHTDQFVRFANDSTILLHWEADSLMPKDPLSSLNHLRMTRNLQVLENFMDHRGKDFHVIKVPSPGIIYHSKPINQALKAGLSELVGSTGIDTIRTAICASYLNYLITNELVILPAYDIPTDETVRSMFQDLFPEREIYQINPTMYNRMSGGIHCLTVHQPLRVRQ